MLPTPKPYRWRGRTYKTLSGLHGAVLREHPGCGLSFEADAMVVSLRDPETRRFAEAARYARDLETNEIADQPTAG